METTRARQKNRNIVVVVTTRESPILFIKIIAVLITVKLCHNVISGVFQETKNQSCKIGRLCYKEAEAVNKAVSQSSPARTSYLLVLPSKSIASPALVWLDLNIHGTIWGLQLAGTLRAVTATLVISWKAGSFFNLLPGHWAPPHACPPHSSYFPVFSMYSKCSLRNRLFWTSKSLE